MQISKRYGPQLDVTDGTIGSCQLVRRFVVARSDGSILQPRQGRFTHPTRESADRQAAAFLENNPPDHINHHFIEGAHAVEWWCYPGHFDPVCPVVSEQEIKDELARRATYPDNDMVH